MQRCLELAKKGFPHNSPNPMVGCVIVYKNRIIGEGYHEKYGNSHAEVNAIDSVKDKSLISQSILYVNLEPCSHFGNTPPCSDLIIKHKIPKVVIGCIDTFTEVSGRGIEKMQKKGIIVESSVLEKESRELNKRFLTFHEEKRPYIILKWAKSKDGFIAPIQHDKSFWMTCRKSKILTHQWRAEEDGILIGRITAEKDNPLLTVREVEGNNPTRIVIDKSLKLSQNLNLFNIQAETIIFNELESTKKHTNNYIKIDFQNVISNMLDELHKRNMHSVIVEGGAKVLQSFITSKLWDEARVFIADCKLESGIAAPIIKGKIVSKLKIDEDYLKIIVND